MSNIDKQALRSTSDRDWFEDWFKREFHPDKTGPYIKDQLFFAVRAARAPLLDELEDYTAAYEEESRDKEVQRSVIDDALCKLLPGCQYMDPPDGGSVTPLEQVRRMIADYREQLQAAEKRIAELEAREELFLRAKALMHQSGGAPIENSLNPIDAWLYDAERAAAAGKGDAS